MRNFKNYVAGLAILAMIFTSCSKDENNMVDNPDQELATLSFAPLLANMDNARAALKQQENGIPTCSDTAPDSVQIILSNAEGDVVGSMGAPFSIDLVNGQLFTEEVPELQLVPGVYSLDHFAVYNAADELIWIAPKTGGDFANWVDNPLPLEINLGAGVKKYVDVTVLCFDDRMVNEYGYLFFELNPEQAVKFCFFANYCDEDGRHYTGNISVDIWIGTDDTGTPLYMDLESVTGTNDDGDFFANPVCFALPANDDLDEEYIYYEVTLLDWPANYGTVSEPAMTGTLSMNDIMANFDGDDNVDYEHLRFNCDGTPNDDDDDGIDDDLDNCPTVPNPDQTNSDGDSHGDACDNCPMDDNEDQADADGDGFGDVCDICEGFDDTMDSDGDGVPDGCDVCPGFDDTMDSDGDGVPDGCDQCEGYDDYIDSDGDGTPDGCDQDTPVDLKDCETAFMWGDTTLISLDLGNKRWGWAEHVMNGDLPLTADLYAGAGQNDITKGTKVGEVMVTRTGDDVEVVINLEPGVFMNETHIYFSDTSAPTTTAPGQYGNTDEDPASGKVYNFNSTDGDFWLIVHAEVCPVNNN